jgi:hypothetical protein
MTYNEELYLVSDNTLHKLSGPETSSRRRPSKLTLAVGEPMNVDVLPAATTRSILWASSVDASGTTLNYSDIRELYIADDLQKSEPQSIADHIPGYIPTGIRALVSSPTLSIVVGTTNVADGKLYVYQYYWNQSEKLQSSWHRWELGDGVRVLGAYFYDNVLHLTLNRGTTTFFERLPCTHLLADTAQRWMVRLDRRVSGLVGTYNLVSNTTSYTLPYSADSDTRAVIAGSGTNFGLFITVASYVGAVVSLQGDTTGYSVVFGQRYTSTFTLSELFLRSASSSQATITDQITRVQVLRVFPQHVETSSYRVEVTPYPGASTFTKEFSPLVLGDGLTASNTVVLRTGSMGAPVRGRNDRVTIKLVSDLHLPCAFTGLQWEGINVQRGRSV